MELYGLYALVHDRVPSAVRRVDRVHVGLYAGRRRLLHPLFPGHCGDRKLCGKYERCQSLEPNVGYLLVNPRLTVSFQVLNLFLALLLSNFGSSSLSAPTADNDTNKIAEAFNRISRFINWIKRSIANGLKNLKNKLTNQISIQPGERPTTSLCNQKAFYVAVKWVS